jgi:cobaltochelatase CobN
MTRVRTPTGKTLKVPPIRGQLFVCEGCCCGDATQGNQPVPHDLYHHEWDRRRLRSKVHLTFTDCIGPCAVANVAYLQIDGHSVWLHSLGDEPSLIGALFDYVERCLELGRLAALPSELKRRWLPRFGDPEPA